MSSRGWDAGERGLISRAARGDVAAFEQLVRDYSGLVYRVAASMLGPDGAQDASQEAWVRAWRNLENFRGDSAFSTWLYRITMNTCLTARKKEQQRESREMGEEFPYLREPSGSGGDPERAALNREQREEILEALRYVRPEHRAAVILRHMEELNYQEMAKVLDVPEGTAKGWASRGRAELLIALSKAGQEREEGESGR